MQQQYKEQLIQLHTAARRYCIDRHAYWWDQYSKLSNNNGERSKDGDYTDNALNIFPRYNILRAILYDIEKIAVDSISSVEEGRELITLAGKTAESIFTKTPIGEIDERAIDEERNTFIQFIVTLSDQALKVVEPLFYRRGLSHRETVEIWTELKRIWGINDWYWYPLSKTSRRDVLAFISTKFDEDVPIDYLRKTLSDGGVTHVWEIRESEVDGNYEMELSVFEPYYNGSEGYWCSNKMDWIIYVSHERSITIGGEWLINAIKTQWSDWTKNLWSMQI